jgi:hypothetical protein
MSNQEYRWEHLPNIGYITAKFTDEQLKPIKDEISKIQNNFQLYEGNKVNQELAGNIKHEYVLNESHDYIEKLLSPLVSEYDKRFNYFQHFNFLTKDHKIVIEKTWVNFQKKYEYNPYHVHSGFLSYVIWINIPYNFEDEQKVAPGFNSNRPSSGMFEFAYASTISNIYCNQFVVDKKSENTLLLFPSSWRHQVYPFYSSDGYRISVSGNFKFDI